MAFSLTGPLAGQEAEEGYLSPQTVFVGDRATLSYPLDPDFPGEPFVREEGLPQGADVRVCRLELERRGGVPWLLIDFIPYAPGLLILPPLPIPGPNGASLTVTGLRVRAASILDPSSMVLSQRAPPLALPGTSLFLYGSSMAVLAFLLLLVGGGMRGKRGFGAFSAGFVRRRLLRRMGKLLARLEAEAKAGGGGGGGGGAEALERLSGEFRSFLSAYTKTDCSAFTASEFRSFPPGDPQPAFAPLEGLFARWDSLRFSGRPPAQGELRACLEDARSFLKGIGSLETKAGK